MKDIKILWALSLIASLTVGCGDDSEGRDDADGGSSSDGTSGASTGDTTAMTVSDTTPTSDSDASSTGADGSSDDATDTTSDTSAGSTSEGTTGASTGSSTGDETESSSGDSGTESSSGGTQAETVEIFAIQDGTVATGTEVVVQEVVVTGVTGLGFPSSFGGFFAQEPEGGANGGIFVFAGGNGPDVSGLSVGDIVTLRGAVVEFPGDAEQQLTELDISSGELEVVGSGGTTPVTDVDLADFADPATAEPWESVLVRITGAFEVTERLERGEFVVAAGDTSLIVDDFLLDIPADDGNFPNFDSGAGFESLTGVINFNAGSFKLAPRGVEDVGGYTEAPPPPGLSIDDVAPGELIITELMYNPLGNSDNNREWIEIYNSLDEDVNLEGMEISDLLSNPTTVQVTTPFLVPAQSYATIARAQADDWEFDGVERVLFAPDLPALNNGGDQVTIRNAAGVIDQSVQYPNADDEDGMSLKLLPDQLDATANDDRANWCFSTEAELFATLDDGDSFGTPSAPNQAECRVFDGE